MLNIHHISAALDYSCFKPGILWENSSQIVKSYLKAESRVSTTGDGSVGFPQCREVSPPYPTPLPERSSAASTGPEEPNRAMFPFTADPPLSFSAPMGTGPKATLSSQLAKDPTHH